MRTLLTAATTIAITLCLEATGLAQAVCLPAPRLLTTMPMGGRIGEQFDVRITGDNIDDAEELRFSHPGISATPKLGSDGKRVPNTFIVSIASDCPQGVHEARLLTRLGISSSRAFLVGDLAETVRSKPNTSLETAMPLELNSVCNAVMTRQSIDYYSFQANKGQRVVVDCAAAGVDSKLKPVLIVADENGADVMVERRGGTIDFTAPEAGVYVVKVHELTYNGGPHYFYRLVLRSIPAGEPIAPLPSTRNVNAFSWPPPGAATRASAMEVEPNNQHTQAQKISLPCDLAGSFFPAADVDTFEFVGKKGDVWWVEVASERLGRPTDPSILVQHIVSQEDGEQRKDVLELSDIPSPVKVSSNGYSYDGPPYNAGSSDILGKLEIKEDGVHRLQIRDLFGGTRNDPRNVYRLIIRKAQPDFALVAWALHMNLRNGDRNALSKPIALRAGATMPIEVVVIRRDGFNGPIDLQMTDLPEGVSAAGLRIDAGQNRGILLVSASETAKRGLSSANFNGRAEINGEEVSRTCRMASMKWPVPDASREIPNPRLLADVPVSVCESEFAPITIAPVEDKVWEAAAGEKLTIPLKHTRRSDFSGSAITLKTFGAGFERTKSFEASLTSDSSTATIDLAALKTPPGEYVIAFYGSAVAKYRYHPEGVAIAKLLLDQRTKEVNELASQMKTLAENAKSATPETKADAEKLAQEATRKHQAATAAVEAAKKHLQTVTAKSQPKDIVDIVVTRPIVIRVQKAVEKK